MIAHASAVSHLALVAVGVASVAVHAAIAGADRWRSTVLVGIGVAVALTASSPPVERLADRTFTGHMVQHLLLIVVAAPALAAGLVDIRPDRSAVGIRRHVPALHRFGSTGARALVGAVVAFVGVLVATHLTPLYDAAIRVPVLHDVEHLAYLASATWLWFVVGWAHRARTPLRLLGVFAVIVGTAITGLVLMSAPNPLVATYARRLGDADALTDQRRAAALMWIATMLVVLPLTLVAAWRWATLDERITRRRELLEDTSARTA